MRIAVIGAGAMGSLYGALLSVRNDVLLVDVSKNRVDEITSNGVTIIEGDERKVYRPKAALAGAQAKSAELVILFVKSMHTESAIERNIALIGPDTLVLSLQNGAGQEDVIARLIPKDRILRGVTQHNASMEPDGSVRHGGGGTTYIGALDDVRAVQTDEAGIGELGVSAVSDIDVVSIGDVDGLKSAARAVAVAKALSEAGIETEAVFDVQTRVWEKLAMNASSSALSGVLGVRHGLCVASDAARELTRNLIRETASVANALGYALDGDRLIREIESRLEASPMGLTSICADIRDGRQTEAEYITGTVVRYARKTGVPAPTHEILLLLLRALDDRARLLEYKV